MTIEVMIDLETMGTTPGSAVVAIGAAASNGHEFHVAIDLTAAMQRGLKVDGPTILWWLGQSDAARALFKGERTGLEGGLNGFRQWLGGLGDGFAPEPPPRLWGNSAAFDLGLLESAYLAIGQTKPWHYQQEACYRTLKNLRRDIEARLFEGVQHNALDDAKHQLEHLMRLLDAIAPAKPVAAEVAARREFDKMLAAAREALTHVGTGEMKAPEPQPWQTDGTACK